MPGEQSGGYHNFWYSITYGDVHWVMISTEHDYSPTSPQYAWLMKVKKKKRGKTLLTL